MTMKRKLRIEYTPPVILPPAEAYDRWSDSYDDQPDNVVLTLESLLFSELLARVAIEGKVVIDIGCGTGRHWKQILSRNPAEIAGVDASRRMLDRLKTRYPAARIWCGEGDCRTEFADASGDVIISTLALAHMRDASRAFREWSRVLRPGGAVLITDFHPDAIRAGMKRTFLDRGKAIEIEHHATELETLSEIAGRSGLSHVSTLERVIDESVRPLYERAHYLDAYEKNKGLPLVFGMHFLKSA
jgi:ubiquinone/menaquinone biosynthesis C-methylase UbiE